MISGWLTDHKGETAPSGQGAKEFDGARSSEMKGVFRMGADGRVVVVVGIGGMGLAVAKRLGSGSTLGRPGEFHFAGGHLDNYGGGGAQRPER